MTSRISETTLTNTFLSWLMHWTRTERWESWRSRVSFLLDTESVFMCGLVFQKMDEALSRKLDLHLGADRLIQKQNLDFFVQNLKASWFVQISPSVQYGPLESNWCPFLQGTLEKEMDKRSQCLKEEMDKRCQGLGDIVERSVLSFAEISKVNFLLLILVRNGLFQIFKCKRAFCHWNFESFSGQHESLTRQIRWENGDDHFFCPEGVRGNHQGIFLQKNMLAVVWSLTMSMLLNTECLCHAFFCTEDPWGHAGDHLQVRGIPQPARDPVGGIGLVHHWSPVFFLRFCRHLKVFFG